MSKNNIPFAGPCFCDEDIKEVKDKIEQIIRSGWLTSGPAVSQLEEMFARFVKTKKAVAVNSCTAALHSVLLASKVKRGDEVIVPSNTFVATANAALYVGAKPVFVDSDPETFNISPSDIQKKICEKTKALIVVHLAGNPCNMKEITEIADDNKITLIEDCAHAHGARYQRTGCGAIGVAGCFSFYPTKIITTAEGGMVTTNNENLAEKVRVARNHGRATHGPTEILELGFNYRLSEIHAAIGLVQMKHVREFVAERNELSKAYAMKLKEVPWLESQHVEKGNLCSYYAYLVKLTEKAPVSRDVLVKKLAERGIGTSVIYHPAHLQPFYVELFGHRRGELPVAEELGEKGLALPLRNGMKVQDVARVVEAIKNIRGCSSGSTSELMKKKP